MALLERGDDLTNQVIGHHHLDLPFLHLLDLTALPDERLTAVQRAKLALAKHLPGAVIVVANSPGTRGEYGGLDLIDVTGRHEEGELVHET